MTTILRKIISVALIMLAGAFAAPVLLAQQPNPSPNAYYATDFNYVIASQSPGTYTWPGTQACQIVKPGGGTFFAFTVGTPVFVRDALNPAHNEIATVTSVVNTASACGFTAALAYTHTSFSVLSGTGGLQEALNVLGGAVAPQLQQIVLTKAWYAQITGLPGATSSTPGTVISSATATNATFLTDWTTSPYSFYVSNGTNLVKLDAPASFFSSNVASVTPLAAPVAVSTSAASAGLLATATTGGTIPASSTYRVAVTYVDASGGETLISTDSASTSTIATGAGTATNVLTLTSPAVQTGAVGYKVYVSAAAGAAGSEILYAPALLGCALAPESVNPACAIGSNATVSAIITGTATVPAQSGAWARVGAPSRSFPPFTALGTVAAGATGTLATVNLPAGYLNVLGKSFEVCGQGYGTTNATAGTLTLAATLASVPGVTSITPFTAVSGATAASAQADPFTFCITFVTSATGATGTLEAHGTVSYSLAGTAPYTTAGDIVITSSSTVDLTKADQLAITLKPTTTALTAAQLRQLVFIPIT